MTQLKKTYLKSSITSELSQIMINAAVAKAHDINQPMVIAILDESAHLKAFYRMDGAAIISIELAQSKAYTAITHPWGMSTKETYQHMQEYPAVMASIAHIPRCIVFGGGYVIKIAGEIVGGLGVSGGNVDQDALVADAALSVL